LLTLQPLKLFILLGEVRLASLDLPRTAVLAFPQVPQLLVNSVQFGKRTSTDTHNLSDPISVAFFV
jgi:hypothetical protein